jgi:hypothetical protein
MCVGFWGKPKGKKHLQDLGVDGSTLKWNVKEQDVRAWSRLFRLRIGLVLC